MKAYVGAAAVFLAFSVSPSLADGLPTITANMVAYTVTAVAHVTVIAVKGALAVTSISVTEYNGNAQIVTIERDAHSEAGCTGDNTARGRYVLISVGAGQTSQLIYPTPLAFFPDKFGYVCLTVYETSQLARAESSVTIVGYTQ